MADRRSRGILLEELRAAQEEIGELKAENDRLVDQIHSLLDAPDDDPAISIETPEGVHYTVGLPIHEVITESGEEEEVGSPRLLPRAFATEAEAMSVIARLMEVGNEIGGD